MHPNLFYGDPQLNTVRNLSKRHITSNSMHAFPILVLAISFFCNFLDFLIFVKIANWD